MKNNFSLIRLWNYLNIYFLKPIDAVNDTITSDLLLKFNWEKKYLEIGSGDGMFSYIMHGNSFPIWFDRYINTNLKNKNIFEVNYDFFPKFKNRYYKIYPNISIDSKKHHINSINKIKFSRKTINANYEQFKYKRESENLIFFYTPHGLKSYSKSIHNISPILKKKGRLLVLLNLEKVKECFICYNLKKKTKGKIKIFFSKLDNGRFNETKKISNTFNNWERLFKKNQLKIKDYYTGLTPFTWRIYDIQTRPILKILIKYFNFFSIFPRTLLKLIWMIALYPLILIIYLLGSNLSKSKNNCYVAFELNKNV